MEKDNSTQSTGYVPVWDVATRLFHWTLVTLIGLAFFTNKYADVIGFKWHKINGYAILCLILFRILWGFCGSSTSRFLNFINPIAAIRYFTNFFSKDNQDYLGHNPLGAMMVLALLAAVTAQAVSGLFSVDDITMMLFAGPLASNVAESTAEALTSYHRIGFNLILGLACIHVVVNIGYSVLKKNGLISAMVTGKKKAGDYADERSAQLTNQIWALCCFAISCAIVLAILTLWGSAPFV
jgi:cytochrome b